MKKKVLNAAQRSTLRHLQTEHYYKDNWERRLRNSLLALSLSDPQWMIFVEREIDVVSMSLPEIVRLIEARARDRVLKAYRFLLSKNTGSYIFRDNWLFTEQGNLGPE